MLQNHATGPDGRFLFRINGIVYLRVTLSGISTTSGDLNEVFFDINH